MDREKIITGYFSTLLNKDNSFLKELFDVDVVYSECYGPEYNGIGQIIQWFNDWNKRGTVLRWGISYRI